MTTHAIKAQGFKLEIETGASSPIVWTEVKEVKSFNEQQAESADIDVTHLQSAAKEFLTGLPDNGTFTGDINFVIADPGQLAMRAARDSQDIQSFKATFSDDSTAEFSGFVKSMPISGGVDQAVTGSFSIKVSGAVVLTPAT
jgi:hypothetical protein